MLKYHIQTIEVGSGGSALIGFSNIPQTYDELHLVVSGRDTGDSNGGVIKLGFNGSSSNYSYRWLQGSGSATSSASSTSYIQMRNTPSSATANTFGSTKITIFDYTSNDYKRVSADSVGEHNATEAYQTITAGLWSDTSAISSIQLYVGLGNFAQYSAASLYGIKHGTSGEVDEITGGTITTSGGYTIHTFNSSGTFVTSRNLEVEYLVVAGGGGGASDSADTKGNGGGGAGGYRSSVSGESSGGGASAESKLFLTANSAYGVTVGAGGPGGYSISHPTNKGSDSSFYTVTSVGGGGGGYYANTPGGPGGSGGGGGPYSGGGGAGTTGQGYAGAAGGSTYGGNGGGAGGAAQYIDTGLGVQSSITGTAVYRASGGAGSGQTRNGSPSPGGGASAQSSGTANTGGGGGGGRSSVNSGSGGSGVVIIRYLTPA